VLFVERLLTHEVQVFYHCCNVFGVFALFAVLLTFENPFEKDLNRRKLLLLQVFEKTHHFYAHLHEVEVNYGDIL